MAVHSEAFIVHRNCPMNAFLFELAAAHHRLEKRFPDLTINIVDCNIDKIPLGDSKFEYKVKIVIP